MHTIVSMSIFNHDGGFRSIQIREELFRNYDKVIPPFDVTSEFRAARAPLVSRLLIHLSLAQLAVELHIILVNISLI